MLISTADAIGALRKSLAGAHCLPVAFAILLVSVTPTNQGRLAARIEEALQLGNQQIDATRRDSVNEDTNIRRADGSELLPPAEGLARDIPEAGSFAGQLRSDIRTRSSPGETRIRALTAAARRGHGRGHIARSASTRSTDPDLPAEPYDWDRIIRIAVIAPLAMFGAAILLAARDELRSRAGGLEKVDPDPLPHVDRRREPRARTRCRSGALFDEHRRLVSDCIIYDRSKHGARVKTIVPIPPLSGLRFLDGHEMVLYRARVAWQRENEAGLALERLYRVRHGRFFGPPKG